ncbi:hypothetical protein V8C34DRAFT_284410 [Trichoderma compactum]
MPPDRTSLLNQISSDIQHLCNQNTYNMKAIILSALVGMASASPQALASVFYNQWLGAGCEGQALLGATLTQGSCTGVESFPSASIKLTTRTPCPAGTSPQVALSSVANDCDNDQPDWTFIATGQCLNVAIQPSTITLNCV